ncbi:LuxR C-terminal-related transcriptional regulator [Occultella aeris]|uniref:DNA-binding transcriptional regulator CsgD n=1 Tax=Occultella aeris TaxID=2761496 RepID=A0A7M4DDB4_9MICO|nr:DNA-binding transcriptional regulator CsgD [Occultella aeris]
MEEFVTRLVSAPRSMVLVGEAGIGKSTLWTYGLDRAADAGYHVLTTRPAEDDWPDPGLGLRDLFGEPGASAAVPAEALAADPVGGAEVYVERLRALTRAAPVVLAIDDLQWLDGLTRRLIRHLLRCLDGEPIAVLATARTWTPGAREVPLRHPVLDADVVEIGPLPVRDLRGVLVRDGRRVTLPDLNRIHEVAGGNPLFALELSRQWHHGERQAVRRSALALLTDQIESLPEESRRILDALAITGPAPLATIGRLATGEAHDVERVLAHLGGPLAHLADLDDHFVLRCGHPLIATAALAALDPVRRQDLHARLVPLLTDPVERARHLALSATVPDEHVAAELEAAAGRAIRRGAASTAAELAAHSVRLTPTPQASHATIRALAEVTFRAGAGQIAQATLLADRLLAERHSAPLHAQILGQRVLLDFAGAETFLRAALDAVGEDQALRGMLLDLLGWQLGLFKGRVAEAMACCEQALDIARARGDREATARAAATLSTVSLIAGVPRRALMAEALRSGAHAGGAPEGSLLRVWPGVFQARQALWDGDLPRARTGFEATLQQAVVLGSEFQRPYRLRDMAMLEISCGRLDLAQALVLQGLEAASDAGNDQAVVWLAHPAGLVAAMRGGDEQALWAAMRIEAWAARVDEPLRLAVAQQIRGVLAAAQGAWAAALEHHLRGLARLDDLGVVHPGFLPALPCAIEAAAILGEEGLCADLVARQTERAAGLGSPWLDAIAVLGRGHARLLAGDLDAEQDFRDSARRLSALGFTLDAHRAGYFAAVTSVRAGRRTFARAELGACRTHFAAQEVAGWTAMVDDALARLVGVDGARLTPTESAVAARVRAGRRNKEIAAELFIGESTVEAHLTRIYRKLDVRGRQQLAALPPDAPARA